MKKIFSIIISICCIFSFNMVFYISPAIAEEETISEIAPEATFNSQTDDVLDQPVFEPETQKKNEGKSAKNRISSIFIKILGGFLLLLVIIICGSFIWIANLQRQREERRKKQSANANVIRAVDNFAKRRIK